MRYGAVTFMVERGRWYRALLNGLERVRFTITESSWVYMASEKPRGASHRVKPDMIHFGENSIQFVDPDSAYTFAGVTSKPRTYTLTEIKEER